jgi:acyl carrier protein
MVASQPRVLSAVLELMATLAGDWEYDGEITADTNLFADLGLESLDLVVLGTTLQERYGRLPFAEFLASIGQRPQQDVSVGELVDFVCQHSTAGAATTTGEAS